MLNGKKILVCNVAGLGDVVMFTPSLRQIKEKYPHCTISFLTKPINKDAIAGLPYIDTVFTIRRGKFLDKLRIILHLPTFDYVFFTDWQPQLSWAAYFLNIPNRIGLFKERYRSSKLFHTHIHNWVFDSTDYVAETIANVFRDTLNITFEGDMTNCQVSSPQERDIQKVNQLLENEGLQPSAEYICLAPFTGAEERNIPLEHCKSFVEMVKGHLHIPVVIIGPPNKERIADEIGAYNLVGKTSLMEMTEIIKRAKLYIGSDSGPMHIAGAVGVNIIALFGKDLSSRWAPKNKCRVISLELPCSPCGDECARECKTLQCINGITPQMLFDVTKEEIMK